MNELSRGERDDLARCEAVIERGLATFVEVGSALLEVRDNGLYRERFGSFEDYCRDRWDLARSRAYQLIDSALVLGNVHHGGQILSGILPTSERQARPLVPLEPDQQRAAWTRAVETAPNGKPTGGHVQSVVDEMFPKHRPLDGQSSFLDRRDGDDGGDWILPGPEPKAITPQPSDAERGQAAWERMMHGQFQVVNSIRKMGGVEVLVRGWKSDDMEEFVGCFDQLIEELQVLKGQLRRLIDEGCR